MKTRTWVLVVVGWPLVVAVFAANRGGAQGRPAISFGIVNSDEDDAPAAAVDPLIAQDVELEQEIQKIMGQVGGADKQVDERARVEARQTVGQLLEKQFAVRQQRREQEIAEIEERVAKLREALKKRADAKQQIVQRRLDDLFSEIEGLGGGDVGGARFGPRRAGIIGGGAAMGIGAGTATGKPTGKPVKREGR